MRSNPDAAGVTKVFAADGTVVAIYPGRWSLADLPSKVHAKADHAIYIRSGGFAIDNEGRE